MLYGDAATNALKLYIGGVVENLYPSGANFSTTDLSLTTTAVTLQSSVKGRRYFDLPAGAFTTKVLLPQPKPICAGVFRRATSQTKSSVCETTYQKLISGSRRNDLPNPHSPVYPLDLGLVPLLDTGDPRGTGGPCTPSDMCPFYTP